MFHEKNRRNDAGRHTLNEILKSLKDGERIIKEIMQTSSLESNNLCASKAPTRYQASTYAFKEAFLSSTIGLFTLNYHSPMYATFNILSTFGLLMISYMCSSPLIPPPQVL